jgi:hypothetical protein
MGSLRLRNVQTEEEGEEEGEEEEEDDDGSDVLKEFCTNWGGVVEDDKENRREL